MEDFLMEMAPEIDNLASSLKRLAAWFIMTVGF